MSEPTQAMLGPGAVIAGRFSVLAIAGSGGMGVVYRAMDRESGSVVALKVLERQAADVRARFERETSLLRDLRHPNIVRYVWHGAEDTQLFLAMEWLGGEDLERCCRTRGALGVDESLTIAESIVGALGAAHAAGLVHRDLKPGNVFLLRDGSLRVLDFGLARPLSDDTRITATGWIVGTPGFMAPEQVRGSGFDARTDLFALGALLFEMLAGRAAFPGRNTVELITAVLTHEPPLLRPDEAPPRLAALVAKLLSKDPAARPGSAAEVGEALRALRQGGLAQTIPPQPPARRFARKEHRSLPVPRWFAWGVLVDSNRWNRIAGSPQTSYSLQTLDGVVERVGEGELFGRKVRWVERGEWWEGSAGRGERHFLDGPFRMIRFAFQTTDAASGTDAEVEVAVEPHPETPDDVVGALLDHLVARLVRYLDAIAAFEGEVHLPRVGPSSMAQQTLRALLAVPRNRMLCGRPPTVDAARLGVGLAALSKDGRVDTQVLLRLEEVLSTFPDDLARRVRPYELAEVWGLARRDVLIGFLEATRAGLFELRWDVLCSACRAPIVPGVPMSRGRAHCAFCRLDFDVDVAENLEGVFTPSRGGREGSPGVYCGGSPAFRPAVVGYLELQPNEARLGLAPPGEGAWAARRSRPVGGASSLVSDPEPRAILAMGDAVVVSPSPEWRVENQTAAPLELSVERVSSPPDGVLGIEMLSLPDYADLLLTDAAARGLELAAGRAVVVQLELRGLDDGAGRVGDAHILGAVLRERTRWEAVARSHRGALHQVAHGSGSLTFADLPGALAFCLEVVRQLASAAVAHELPELGIAAGVAEAAALFVSSGSAVEPFGEAARLARGLAASVPTGAVGVPVSARLTAAQVARDEGWQLVEERTRVLLSPR